MFDVIWTDPDRESVGQRKNRKKKEGVPDPRKENNRMLRVSVSTHSSQSSAEKPFGMFSGTNSKKAIPATPAKASTVVRSTPPALPRPSHATSEGQSFRDSLFGGPLAPISSSNGYSYHSGPMLGTNSPRDTVPDLSENSPPGLDSQDSNYSKRTDNTTMPATPIFGFDDLRIHPGSKSQVIQTLGPSSFVTKTTEVVVEPRSPDLDGGHPVSDVIISADPMRRLLLPRPSTPPFPREETKAVQTKKWLYSIPNRTRSISPPKPEPHLHHHASPVPPVPIVREPPGSPRTPANKTNMKSSISASNESSRKIVIPAPSSVFRNENPDAWRPPAAWDCSPSVKPVTASLDAALVSYRTEERARHSGSFSLDLIAMQREMKIMDAANPQTILARLQEDWADSADPALRRELEMVKKRWMLSAMYNVDRPGLEVSDAGSVAPRSRDKEKGNKILALFESQATASYLAAAHCDAFIYHMSPSPISHDLFPNVLPTTLPVVSHLALSTAPDMFSAVHCLSLPSLVPSSEIPPLLRNIHRTLRPDGALHVVLIDPSPAARSLGPRMRHWIEENLQLNLERKFRCVSPRKLFPGWLGDARLRGGGSTITTVRFFAVPPLPSSPSSSAAAEDDGTASGCGNGHSASSSTQGSAGSRGDKEVRTELRSVVGRMLWTEVWGQFVSGSKWWWEDPLCVKECHELGTYWEYNIIEAAKEDPKSTGPLPR